MTWSKKLYKFIIKRAWLLLYLIDLLLIEDNSKTRLQSYLSDILSNKQS